MTLNNKNTPVIKQSQTANAIKGKARMPLNVIVIWRNFYNLAEKSARLFFAGKIVRASNGY